MLITDKNCLVLTWLWTYEWGPNHRQLTLPNNHLQVTSAYREQRWWQINRIRKKSCSSSPSSASSSLSSSSSLSASSSLSSSSQDKNSSYVIFLLRKYWQFCCSRCCRCCRLWWLTASVVFADFDQTVGVIIVFGSWTSKPEKKICCENEKRNKKIAQNKKKS